MLVPATSEHCFDNHHLDKDDGGGDAGDDEDGVDHLMTLLLSALMPTWFK